MKQLQANQTISTPKSASVNELVVNHLQLGEKYAHKVAKEYAHEYGRELADYNISTEELYSAAYLGLCKAASLYDPNKGASFATYAFYHVRKYVIEELELADGFYYAHSSVESFYENDGDERVCTLQVADPYDMEEHACASSARKHLLRTLKHVLTAREYEVITRFYGFVGQGEAEDERTIAKSLGASRQAINQSKNNALQKMERELPVSFWNELLGQ